MTVGEVEEVRVAVPPAEWSQPWPKEAAPVPPFDTPRVPVKRLVPILVVATTRPSALVASKEERRPVKAREVVVALVVVAEVAKVEEAIRERGEPVSHRPVLVACTPWPAY